MQKALIMTVAFFTACVVQASGADMTKTAPALQAPSGSEAQPANTKGIEHYNQGHWDVAKKHFQEATKADPDSAVAHYNLALALDKAGDHKTAIEHFKKAKELGKGNPEIQESEILQAHLKHAH